MGGPPLQVDPATGLVYNTGFDPGTADWQLDGAVDSAGEFNYTVTASHCAGNRTKR